MKIRIAFAIVVGIGLILSNTQPGLADPMRCSGEQKTCNANCLKIARTAVADCLAVCHVTQQSCMHTGCWADGTSKYCGLMKQ
jgi:hypothetical protein